jgi:hypothetical protein
MEAARPRPQIAQAQTEAETAAGPDKSSIIAEHNCKHNNGARNICSQTAKPIFQVSSIHIEIASTWRCIDRIFQK